MHKPIKKCILFFIMSFAICFILLFASIDVAGAAQRGDTVYLVSPANESWTNHNNDTLEFVYNHTGTLSGAVNCTLYLDNVAVNYKPNVTANTNIAVYSNTAISEGTHWWWVNCS